MIEQQIRDQLRLINTRLALLDDEKQVLQTIMRGYEGWLKLIEKPTPSPGSRSEPGEIQALKPSGETSGAK